MFIIEHNVSVIVRSVKTNSVMKRPNLEVCNTSRDRNVSYSAMLFADKESS